MHQTAGSRLEDDTKMNIVFFGATGVVGQGALRECLQDPEVNGVVSIVRSPTGLQREKLREIVHQNFVDFSAIANELTGLDACLFCLGVTSSGMSEEAYTRVTYEFTIAAATTLLQANPGMTFVFVSGQGTDSTEKGRVMWARVKGRTENALLAMSFRSAYMFRPGLIQPLDGIQSKTASYRVWYRLSGPLLSLARKILPRYITTTRELGQAMLAAAKHGIGKRVVEASEIGGLLASLTKRAGRQPSGAAT
jgi:uncharacterized protein YbjT (DUF2867 family)